MIAPGTAVVEWVSAARDAVYVGVLDGGLNRVFRVAFAVGAKPQMIELPKGEESGYALAATPKSTAY